MTELTSIKIVVYGRVQGVFFRAFVAGQARELGLTGYVRNLPAGEAVEVQAEGERKKLEELVKQLNIGPPAGKVEKVVTDWSGYTGSYPSFSIRY